MIFNDLSIIGISNCYLNLANLTTARSPRARTNRLSSIGSVTVRLSALVAIYQLSASNNALCVENCATRQRKTGALVHQLGNTIQTTCSLPFQSNDFINSTA